LGEVAFLQVGVVVVVVIDEPFQEGVEVTFQEEVVGEIFLAEGAFLEVQVVKGVSFQVGAAFLLVEEEVQFLLSEEPATLLEENHYASVVSVVLHQH